MSFSWDSVIGTLGTLEEGRKEGRNHELGLGASVLALSQPRLCPGGKQNLSPHLCVFDFSQLRAVGLRFALEFNYLLVGVC